MSENHSLQGEGLTHTVYVVYSHLLQNCKKTSLQ